MVPTIRQITYTNSQIIVPETVSQITACEL
jgi:hypothetical protein